MNQNVTLNYNFEDAFVLGQEAEEKRKRLEEAEKKRQAMMQAQKEKQQAGGPGKGGQKKTDGGVSVINLNFLNSKFSPNGNFRYSLCNLMSSSFAITNLKFD